MVGGFVTIEIKINLMLVVMELLAYTIVAMTMIQIKTRRNLDWLLRNCLRIQRYYDNNTQIKTGLRVGSRS